MHLQQPTAAGAQHADLMAVERCEQHEAVEGVVVERAVAHRTQRVQEPSAGAQRIEARRARCALGPQLELEVLQRHGLGAGRALRVGRDAPRSLGEHAQTEVLEYRQQRRDRFGGARSGEPQMQTHAWRAGGAP